MTRWSGKSVEVAVPSRAHALYSGLAAGGAFAQIVFDSGKAGDDGLWLLRDGAWRKLRGRPADISQISVAPDGALIIADEMVAYGWVPSGKAAGKSRVLLDQSGFHIKAIAATNKWLIVVDAGGNILKARRPG